MTKDEELALKDICAEFYYEGAGAMQMDGIDLEEHFEEQWKKFNNPEGENSD